MPALHPPSSTSARWRAVPAPLVLGMVAAVLFAVLALVVAGAGVPPAEAWEAHWLQQLHAQRGDRLTRWMLAVEAMHDPLIAVLLSVFVTALLFQRHWRKLPLLLAITLGGGVMNNIAKGWFQRERPLLDALVEARGFGFPSGHTVAATLLAAWMLYLASRGGLHAAWRVASVLGASALVGVVGFSRVYLGAHYPSDVAAALLAGTAWACGCIAVFGASASAAPPRTGRQPAARASTNSPA